MKRFTNAAVDFEIEIINLIEPVIDRYIREGYSKREMHLLLNNAVLDTILMKILINEEIIKEKTKVCCFRNWEYDVCEKVFDIDVDELYVGNIFKCSECDSIQILKSRIEDGNKKWFFNLMCKDGEQSENI